MSGTTSRSGGGSKQAAARSEKAKKAKTASWNGVKLPVPPELPRTIGLDLGHIESLERAGKPTLGALYDLVYSLIGDDGMASVRQVLQNGAGKKYEAIDGRLYTDVLDAVMKAYGSTVGESSASTTS